MSHTKVLVAVCLTLAGCTPDWHGILASDVTGTPLDPPATRRDPLEEVRAACGQPDAPSATIPRRPYLGSVSTDHAFLTWTSTAETPETVELWVPGGDSRTVTPAIDETRYLSGARQETATLDALAAGTIHCYALLDATGERVYGPAGFRTAPASDDAPVSIAVIGDSGGGGPDQIAVAEQLRTVPIDLMLHVGDVVYMNGSMGELEANHFPIYDPLFSTVPFFPAYGDHDYATDAGGPFFEAFHLPENGDHERYYSLDWGSVHVAVLDAIVDDEAQRAWLEADLAATTKPWRIVVVHVPPYSSGWHGGSGSIRQWLAPILERHDVQLVLSGDDLDFQRSRPINGVTYVVTGGGGMSVRPLSGTDWSAFEATVFHFTYITVDGDVMRVRAIDATGREFDGVEIPRQPS